MRIAAVVTQGAAPTGVDEVFYAEPGAVGAALKRALAETSAELLTVDAPQPELERLVAPLRAGALDVVIGRRARIDALDRATNRLARVILGGATDDAASPVRAFRTEALRAESLRALDAGADAEALVKLHAQQYRIGEVTLETSPVRPARDRLALARTFARYATVQNDADNEHEGYSTLRTLEASAPNYNAWLARAFAPFAGQRVLEIGAGIGTITAHLAQRSALVTALEVDPFYVRRLKNRFRGQPNVEPLLGDVALADWESLAERRFDTIVLSNVLEHIADDAGAVRTFARILPPGGRVLIFVPALPFLFGSLDEAVGHHRRYVPSTLRDVLEQNGFVVEHLKWMNAVGIPGWFLNGRILGRRTLPPLQVRLYDSIAPLIASAESRFPLPVGMSLLAVARRD